jgi:hypothetical protein
MASDCSAAVSARDVLVPGADRPKNAAEGWRHLIKNIPVYFTLIQSLFGCCCNVWPVYECTNCLYKHTQGSDSLAGSHSDHSDI